MNRTVGIVIPAYRPDVEQVAAYVRTIDEHLTPTAIRIEFDDPQPGTQSQFSDVSAIVNTASTRRGKGAAITYGFERLDTDVLVFADADGSVPVESIEEVIKPVLNETADLAVGSRRHPAATIRSHQTYARRWLGHGFAWLARRLLDAQLHDYQCGAKAIDHGAWQNIREHLYEPGFGWDIDLIAMAVALDHRIVEVPVIWEDQPRSTVSTVETPIELARALLAAHHRGGLLKNDPLHEALDTYRPNQLALVHRSSVNDD